MERGAHGAVKCEMMALACGLHVVFICSNVCV